jgi:chloramphenicol 3-O phosphotransferase
VTSTVVYLNGVSSAGKSTLARALVEATEEPYCLVPMDAFEGMAQRRFPLPGAMDFYDTCLVPLMHHAAAAFADAGLGVVVDAVITRADWLRDAARQLSGHRMLLVGVHCDLAELRRRERARGDRGAGKAEAPLAFVHQIVRELCGYDFEVDTTRASAEGCARLIKHRLAVGSAPDALGRLRVRASGDRPRG